MFYSDNKVCFTGQSKKSIENRPKIRQERPNLAKKRSKQAGDGPGLTKIGQNLAKVFQFSLISVFSTFG